MPQTPDAPVAGSDNWIWVCTQKLELGALQVTAAAAQELKTGVDAGGCAWLGSSFAITRAAFAALIAFTAGEFPAVHVVQYGAAPARAPSCAARVIAP